MTSNRQFLINMFTSILAFFVNVGIQFIVTPIITKNIGDEAYGFITLANDFTNYAAIFAVVLNSVASRFISVEYHKGNLEDAEIYYSSVFWGNVIISIVLAIAGLFIIKNFHYFLNISSYLINDVKITFFFTFLNYIVSVLISVFTVSTFVKNRMDIVAIRNAISYFVKLILIIILFTFIPNIKVYFLAVATLGSTLFLAIANMRVAKSIMPEICIKIKKFSVKYIINLLKTGIWMGVNNLFSVITNNLTTLILNIYSGGIVAGFFSVAKTIPNSANSFVYAIYNVFTPTFLKLYAEEKKEELKNYGIQSMRIMSFVVCVPLIVLIAESLDFLLLWQGYRSMDELTLMSKILVISTALVVIYAPLLPLSQLGLAVNKIGIQTINNIFISIISLISVLIVAKYYKSDLIIISAATLLIQGIKWIFFTPIYAAYVTNLPLSSFFAENIKIITKEIILFICLYVICGFYSCNSWFSLFISISCLCLLSYISYFVLLLNKSDKKIVLDYIHKHLNRLLND